MVLDLLQDNDYTLAAYIMFVISNYLYIIIQTLKSLLSICRYSSKALVHKSSSILSKVVRERHVVRGDRDSLLEQFNLPYRNGLYTVYPEPAGRYST